MCMTWIIVSIAIFSMKIKKGIFEKGECRLFFFFIMSGDSGG